MGERAPVLGEGSNSVMRLKRTDHYRSLALLVVVLFALWVQLPRLADPYVVEEDFRNLYWLHLLRDPDLFPERLYLEQQLFTLDLGGQRQVVSARSPMYGIVFQIGAHILELGTLSKLLIFPLLLISVYYLYGVAERTAGSGTALALSLAFITLNLASHSATSVTAGLQRSFTVPLLLALLYYLQRQRVWPAALAVFLSGTIYPAIFPVAALTYGLWLLRLAPGLPLLQRVNWRQTLPLLLACTLVIVAISPALVAQVEATGDTVSQIDTAAEHKLLDPDYGPGGRYQIFHVFPLIGRGGFASGISDGIHMAALGLIALVIWFVNGREVRPLPHVFRLLGVASVGGFALSWGVFLLTSSFLLYLPSRYTQAPFLLLLLVFIIFNAEHALQRLAAMLTRPVVRRALLLMPLVAVSLAVLLPQPEGSNLGRQPAIRFLLAGLGLVLALLLYLRRRHEPNAPSQTPVRPRRRSWAVLGIVLMVASLGYVKVVQREFYDPTPEQRALFSFLETVPRDSLIAGDPCTLASVPLYARREVLMSCERMPRDDAAVLETLAVYYAEEPALIAEYCQATGADYFVVNEVTFEPEVLAAGTFFFEPYTARLQPALLARERFALLEVPPDSRLFTAGPYHVVSCKEIGRLAGEA